MEKEEYRKHYELEESHWWFVGRRAVILGQSRRFLHEKRRIHILDAGCGTGFNLMVLREHGNSFGCDISWEALSFCRRRGLENIVQADVARLPYKDNAFDFITFLDVLYHKNVKSDTAVLKDAGRILRADGYLCLSDSAFNFLKSTHDLAFHTRERYRKSVLRIRLERAGFYVLKISYFNFFLFPVVIFFRLLKKMGRRGGNEPKSDLKPMNRRINSALATVLKWEARLLKHINLPFGSSLICLARKRGGEE